MNIGFIIYNEITALDFIGIYDPISRIKTMGIDNSISIDICGYDENVKDFSGEIKFLSKKIRPSLNNYDVIVLPGGFGTRKLEKDKKFISWIQTANSCATFVSVCSGALILGAAGKINGKTITTHKNLFKEIKKYGCIVKDERIVFDGNLITARGVTSAIDLGLFLCGAFYGIENMKLIAKQMDYEISKNVLEILIDYIRKK